MGVAGPRPVPFAKEAYQRVAKAAPPLAPRVAAPYGARKYWSSPQTTSAALREVIDEALGSSPVPSPESATEELPAHSERYWRPPAAYKESPREWSGSSPAGSGIGSPLGSPIGLPQVPQELPQVSLRASATAGLVASTGDALFESTQSPEPLHPDVSLEASPEDPPVLRLPEAIETFLEPAPLRVSVVSTARAVSSTAVAATAAQLPERDLEEDPSGESASPEEASPQDASPEIQAPDAASPKDLPGLTLESESLPEFQGTLAESAPHNGDSCWPSEPSISAATEAASPGVVSTWSVSEKISPPDKASPKKRSCMA